MSPISDISNDASQRTDDPTAVIYDEAICMFRQSIKYTFVGRYKKAIENYTAAFMADEELTIAMATSGTQELPDEMAMRPSLLACLAEYAKASIDRIENKILLIAISFLPCAISSLSQDEALRLGNRLTVRLGNEVVTLVAEQPDQFERNSNICGGYLTLAKARGLYSKLLLRSNQAEIAYEEAKKALELEPRSPKYRVHLVQAQITVGIAEGVADSTEEVRSTVCHLNRAVTDSHEDSRYRPLIYGMLSELRMKYPDIGTWEEVESTIIRMKQARERSIEIFGVDFSDASHGHAFNKACEAYEDFTSNAQILQKRRALDKTSGRKATANYTLEQVSCYGCGTDEGDFVRLKACGLCSDALYCSKECQKEDWSFHKSTCKGAKTHVSQWQICRPTNQPKHLPRGLNINHSF